MCAAFESIRVNRSNTSPGRKTGALIIYIFKDWKGIIFILLAMKGGNWIKPETLNENESRQFLNKLDGLRQFSISGLVCCIHVHVQYKTCTKASPHSNLWNICMYVNIFVRNRFLLTNIVIRTTGDFIFFLHNISTRPYWITNGSLKDNFSI